MNWFKRAVRAVEPYVIEKQEKPAIEMKCTYCGSTKFYEGPSGGISTNILCANSDCRHWFNWHGGILPMDDLHRVEPSEAEKAIQTDAEQLKRDNEFGERMKWGAHFFPNSDIGALRQRQLKGRSTYVRPEQLDEICGFISALSHEIRELKSQVEALKERK